MSKGEFNLLHEKWVLATDFENKVESFSILEIFKKAHKLKNLAGELSAQDVAILRLLLSVLHTVFYRHSPNGKKDELENKQQGIRRWRELWEANEFPYSLIEEYLISYEERFYLFHNKYPFMQVKNEDGFWTSEGERVAFSEKELNYFVGEIAESKNSKNLFLSRERSSELACDEAARWLIHINSFDLSPSGRPPKGVIKGYGSAWLANLGLVYLQGETLFETMMLNLVLGPVDEDDYVDEKPIWEDEIEIDGNVLQTIYVPLPRTLNKLYSMRLRFIELLPNEDKKAVTKVRIWSGCKFVEQNQFIEPMTVWRKVEEGFEPKLHSAKKRVWQDFAALLIKHQKDTKRPGVLDWIQELKESDTEGIGFINLKTIGYETKNNSAIKDMFSDGLAVHSQLIERAEEGGWLLRIRDEVEAIEKLVNQAGWLAKDLVTAKANSDNKGNHESNKAKEQAYSRLDIPFRQWLEHIIPETDDMNDKCNAWREEAKKIIRQLGDELVKQAGPQAMVGRYKDDQLYTAATAHIQFLSRVKKI